MYKKIYLEITNLCNLHCDFCIQNKRKEQIMDLATFTHILTKIKDHTQYLYFHLLGEPLMHPRINEFIDLASKDFKINITTNGYLIERIKENKNIRQINISLHSYHPRYKVPLDTYMSQLFTCIDTLKKYSYISLRFWVSNPYSLQMIEMINQHYHKNIKLDTIQNNTTLTKNIFLSKNEFFIWPDLENKYENENGTCYALKDHIGILVDGTVVPCCLDTKGNINLGNILKQNLDDIIQTRRYQVMLEGFRKHKKEELLCKKCKFL